MRTWCQNLLGVWDGWCTNGGTSDKGESTAVDNVMTEKAVEESDQVPPTPQEDPVITLPAPEMNT